MDGKRKKETWRKMVIQIKASDRFDDLGREEESEEVRKIEVCGV